MVDTVERYLSLVVTLQHLVDLICHTMLAYVGSKEFGNAS